jgi:dipeptidyl aminopeptidase/acylaminoacyl peptidase
LADHYRPHELTVVYLDDEKEDRMNKLFALLLLLICSTSTSAQSYTIEQYLNIKSASSPTFSPDNRHIAYLTNVTGTQQVWVVDLPNGKPRQLTNYDDNIGFVKWLGDGSGMIFGKAKGGDENTQFFWMKPDGTGVRALTDEPKVRHNFAEVSDDGKTIYYASNKRNPTYFDVYSMDVASGKEDLLYQFDGNINIAAVNSSGSKFIVSRDSDELSLDNSLYLIDARTKKETLLTPHNGASEFGNVHFVADGIIYSQNNDREFMSLSQMRKKNAAGDDWSEANRQVSIIDDSKWDVSDIEMNDSGSTIAYTLNRDGFSELYLRNYETDGKPLITVVDKTSQMVKLPAQGIVGGLTLSKDESKLAFSFSSARQNSDVWVYDVKTKALSQLTHSDKAGIDPKSFVAPQLIKFKTFDGREIPAWYYDPTVKAKVPADADNNPQNTQTITYSTGNTPHKSTFHYSEPYFSLPNGVPVVVSVHGGPEGQERPGFSGLYQYYLSRGYAILATNVRGSTGYGKTYTHLDDVTHREDSVKDLAYAVEWLKTKGGADPKRVAVMGGSYGGYMTLAAITLYPDLWAAAVDTVGISNWETFLKNTSGYRRRQREVEYGRLDRDIEFLRSISPIAKIDRIKCPLFVIAGRNDPRVPWTEGQQMVDALRKRGATVEWKVYDDEGHGVSKLKNRLDLYPRVANFLDTYMK